MKALKSLLNGCMDTIDDLAQRMDEKDEQIRILRGLDREQSQKMAFMSSQIEELQKAFEEASEEDEEPGPTSHQQTSEDEPGPSVEPGPTYEPAPVSEVGPKEETGPRYETGPDNETGQMKDLALMDVDTPATPLMSSHTPTLPTATIPKSLTEENTAPEPVVHETLTLDQTHGPAPASTTSTTVSARVISPVRVEETPNTPAPVKHLNPSAPVDLPLSHSDMPPPPPTLTLQPPTPQTSQEAAIAAPTTHLQVPMVPHMQEREQTRPRSRSRSPAPPVSERRRSPRLNSPVPSPEPSNKRPREPSEDEAPAKRLREV